MTWGVKLWSQCCGGGGTPCWDIITSQAGDPRRERSRAQAGGACGSCHAEGCLGVHIILLCSPPRGCSACTQLHPFKMLTQHLLLKFLFFFSFAYFQIGAQHRESERDGVKEGWRVCRGGLFLGLTFGRSRGLSQVRPKDSITPCLHLCPCLQGTVLRAKRAQLTACEQRSSLAFMRSLGLFLLLQTSEWFLICRLLTSTQPDRKGNYVDGGVLREVNLTFP